MAYVKVPGFSKVLTSDACSLPPCWTDQEWFRARPGASVGGSPSCWATHSHWVAEETEAHVGFVTRSRSLRWLGAKPNSGHSLPQSQALALSAVPTDSSGTPFGKQ